MIQFSSYWQKWKRDSILYYSEKPYTLHTWQCDFFTVASYMFNTMTTELWVEKCPRFIYYIDIVFWFKRKYYDSLYSLYAAYLLHASRLSLRSHIFLIKAFIFQIENKSKEISIKEKNLNCFVYIQKEW
jgi:hypothetical protein